MATSPFVVERFNGLRLDIDPEDLGLQGAVDLLNVDFDKPQWVRTRAGSQKWSGTAVSSSGYQAIFPSPTHSGEFILIRGSSGGSTSVDRMPDGGTITNVGSIGSTVIPIDSAAIGTTTSTTIYFTAFTSPSTGVTIRKYDGTTFGTGTGKPTHVATWPTSNRLVQGGYFAGADAPAVPSDGSTANRCTVFFSDPGAPDTYATSSFVHLRPGDGEAITAIVSWRDLLFVFKESSVFVFYGESVSGTGTPIFNYRRVDLPTPIFDVLRTSAGTGAIAIPGPDAVYYSTPRGIYRTVGEVPVLFSGPVSGVFSLDPSTGSGLRSNGNAPILAWVCSRLVASYTTALSTSRQLVYHTPTGQWTLWSLPGGSYTASTSHLTSDALLIEDGFWFVNGNDVWVWSPGLNGADGGVAFSWSYTSGYYSLNDQARVTATLESKLTGTGSVTMKVATAGGSSSSGGVLDTGSTVTLGTTTPDDGWQQIDREGSLFQHQMSGSGSAALSRLVHYAQFTKPPGIA